MHIYSYSMAYQHTYVHLSQLCSLLPHTHSLRLFDHFSFVDQTHTLRIHIHTHTYIHSQNPDLSARRNKRISHLQVRVHVCTRAHICVCMHSTKHLSMYVLEHTSVYVCTILNICPCMYSTATCKINENRSDGVPEVNWYKEPLKIVEKSHLFCKSQY